MMTLDLGPALVYVVQRAARHLDGLGDGDALAVDVGDQRVEIERRADGWVVAGDVLPSRAAVLAVLQRAAADWLVGES